ncbi:hypothetical protein [Streptomyces albidoflavus]|nr:hypothetical protein [Streptomyces albidoflavus]
MRQNAHGLPRQLLPLFAHAVLRRRVESTVAVRSVGLIGKGQDKYAYPR